MKALTRGGKLMQACVLLAMAMAAGAAQGAEPGPRFNAAGELLRPADYAEWVFLTSGLGMTYGPNGPDASRPPAFDNAFVNPAAYKAFMQTGRWPEGTMFVLEIRASEENASINNGGRTQGAMRAMEAAVKDTTRYPDGGWAYFSFDGPGGLKEATAPFPRTANCYSCHSQHAAVEWTFTQFYPRLFEVAKQKGTVRADYDPALKAK
jgi:Cytochrome P460